MKNITTFFRAAGIFAFSWALLGLGSGEGRAYAQSAMPTGKPDAQIVQGDTTATTAMSADTVMASAESQPEPTALEALVQKVQDVSVTYFPQALGALLVLLLGWLLALFISWVIRFLLKRTGLDEKLGKWTSGEDAETRNIFSGGIAKIIFYIIMLFVVVAVFQTLQLSVLTDPINMLLGRVFEFVPQLVAAALLFAAAWIIASIVRFAVTKMLVGVKFDERFGGEMKGVLARGVSLSKTIGDLLYWITFLVFLPAIVATLGMQGLIVPVQEMLNGILAAVPNVFGAILIFFVGWMVARIVSRFVVNALTALGTDGVTDRIGLKGTFGGRSISQLIGTLVYALIIIPVTIAALNTLKIETISKPAIEMLTTVMNAVPSIFAAGILLVVTYIVARLLKDITSNVLKGIGFNNVPVWLGLSKKPVEGDRSPSEIASYVVLVAIVLFALVESLQLLGFTLLADLLTRLIAFGGKIVLGLLIFGVGLFLSNLAEQFISSGDTDRSRMYAQIVRYIIIVFVGAMALHEMGIADDIINLAFGIILGAIAITFAIAFGVGSRNIAADQVEKWLKHFKGSSK